MRPCRFPRQERATAVAIWTSGNQFGMLLCYPLAGIFCPLRNRNSFDADGWPLIFYTCGVSALVALVLSLVVVSDSPEQHRFIGQDEREFLRRTLAGEQFRSRKVRAYMRE